MIGEFYNYIKKQIKSIPCSAKFCDLYILDINEDYFVEQLQNKYSLTLINFDRDISYKAHKPGNNYINEKIIYHLKLNNQMYLKYVAINGNYIKPNIKIDNIEVYSSTMNKKELITLTNYINDLIKKQFKK